jgi:hypothetical protein
MSDASDLLVEAVVEGRERNSLGDAVEAIDFAIDLYLGNFDLMVEARTPAISRRVRDNFHALQEAIRAHAPWAQPELVEVLVAHTEVYACLSGAGGELRQLQERHTRAVDALRAFVAASPVPWG